MFNTSGEQLLRKLKFRFTFLYALRIFIISLTIALVLTAVLVYVLLFNSWTFLPIFLIVFSIFAIRHPFWKITSVDISRYLNQEYPELEESTGLFLRPSTDLSYLEQLQKEKIDPRFQTLKSLEEPLNKLYIALALLASGLLLSYFIHFIKPTTKQQNLTYLPSEKTAKPYDQIPAEVASFQLFINPPSYTRKKGRTQRQFSLNVEVGAIVKWNIKTNIRVRKMRLIFNGKETINLKSLNASGTEWATAKKINQAGFYQIELDGKRSDLYAMEIIPDLPVTIEISRPKQHTTIDYGQPFKVDMFVTLKDDYGIKDAFISATMASGKGEGVSFTERKLSINTTFSNKKEVQIRQTIDLKGLGMKPGDELYFFVKAMDSYGQASRSDVYFVSIVDTAELMSMSAVSNGVNLVPEYFRSERQIIIDTEKLLKERPSLTEEVFKSRSNALGVDQKLLRLRYGTFLGEESETEIGGEQGKKDTHEHDEGKGTDAEEKFGDVQGIMDRYAHKHDVAEDATFFEPELKARLKAVLTEMWSAELRLRTYKTSDALPFEYKALRLLKDLQQKSRAYVAKTTVKVSQLKEEKRLSGTLDKIFESSQKHDFERKDVKNIKIKKLLTVLENTQPFKNSDHVLLKEAEQFLIEASLVNPKYYLPALKGIRDLQSTNRNQNNTIKTVQRALLKMIVTEQPKPQIQALAPGSGLYRNYYNYLNKASK